MSIDHYTYRVTWSAEDGEHVGLSSEFPSLSHLDKTPEATLAGIRQLIADIVTDWELQGRRSRYLWLRSTIAGNFACALHQTCAEPWQYRPQNRASA